MLHTVDTQVQMLPQVTIPLYEVSVRRGHRALHLQTDLSQELCLGGVEESVRQEKLERSIPSFKIFPCERSDTFFKIFVVLVVLFNEACMSCHIFVLICHFLCQVVIH